MRPKAITLFMWGYQEHFRIHFEQLMVAALGELGVHDVDVKCFLVGTRMPNADVPHDVCLEPEDGVWPLGLFAELPHSIQETIDSHPLQQMFYGDERSMNEKPENIRRDATRLAVQAALVNYDNDNKVRSFAGRPAPVEGYYVVPILQLHCNIFERFPPLREPVCDDFFTSQPSLIHATVMQVLQEAYDELLRPAPGGRVSGRSASPSEIVRRAAADFLCTPVIAIGDKKYGSHNLFERFNLISSLMYEGTKGTGTLLLGNPDGGEIDVALAFAEPVPFRESRWSRKVLQMASGQTDLIADSESILGLGNISEGTDAWASQKVFEIEFHDHYQWSLSCGSQVLLVSQYGAPSLPHESFSRHQLIDTYERLFPRAAKEIATFIALFDVAVAQRHGSMLVVASDAREEAERLREQGTKVIPVKLSPELYRSASKVDGTIIIDPYCICYAIGVILDGPARPECTPSRGARYNSGIRYIGASSTPRLAVVVSDDRTVDVIPVLRPRIRRSAIEKHIERLEGATRDDYHPAIGWLDRHRFYLDQLHCDRINAELKRIGREPMEVGEFMIQWETFQPDAACTAEYFMPD